MYIMSSDMFIPIYENRAIVCQSINNFRYKSTIFASKTDYVRYELIII